MSGRKTYFSFTDKCELCKGYENSRLSPSMSSLYSTIRSNPLGVREDLINELFDNGKECSVARMAVIFNDGELAGKFVDRFSESTKPLSVCPYRLSALGFRPPMAELAGSVEMYIQNQQNPGFYEDSLSLKETYDFDSRQGVQMQILEERFLA